MKRRVVFLIYVSLTALLLFFITNAFFRGYLHAEYSLAKELKSSPDAIDENKLSREPPFKYRVLFTSIVQSSYRVLYDDSSNTGFYRVYTFWSALFYVSSAITMYLLLLTCRFSEKQSFLGALIFLLLPAMLLAFTLPVHTREDTLGYTLFFIGLIFLITNKPLLFFIVSLLGVLCRETLLLLPLLYFFYSNDKNLIRRILWIGIPCLMWLSIRFLIGFEKYEVWEGLKWNLNNPEQIVGFLLVAFNVCWISFAGFVMHRQYYLRASNSYTAFFFRSVILAVSVVLITTFLGGIFNEIRLLYLLSPWMIIIFLSFLNKNSETIKVFLQRKSYWWYASSVLLFCFLVLYVFLNYHEQIITERKYAVPYPLWISFSVCYIFITLLFLPFLLSANSKLKIQNLSAGKNSKAGNFGNLL